MREQLRLPPRCTRSGVALGAALSALLTGCAIDGDLPPVGTDAREQIMLNQIMLNQIMLNGLMAMPDTIDAVVSHPLAASTYEAGAVGDLGYRLHDPDARMFLTYVARCALSPDQAFAWTDPYDDADYEFRGALGLCPEWHTGPASTACQHIVSSCLLASNNAHGLSVMYSPRAELPSGGGIPLGPRVPAKPTTRDGEPIASFEPCGGAEVGAARDCGWRADASWIGRCTPGAAVVVGAGAPPPDACAAAPVGAAAGEPVLRICAGLAGCNHGSADMLAEADGTCGTGFPSAAFTCPASGTFAVLVGPRVAEDGVWAEPAAIGALFPAPEAAVFTVREGAFYGNLFDGASRTADVTYAFDASTGTGTWTVAPTSGAAPIYVYENMWACYDPGWTFGDAYLHDRLCAIGAAAELCAARVVGPCAPRGWQPGACATGDGPAVAGDRDFQDCRDRNHDVWPWPVTSVLNGACDAVPRDRQWLCDRRPVRPRLPVRRVVSRRRSPR
ncbi:MAG: hypothetical protein D6689_13070 [Deltaproteobacteria bacterium]|nr:MAG: hypothetical protein D6689_13070 [Deltaproteobacteria bacterium]